jgi:hypothetical protein
MITEIRERIEVAAVFGKGERIRPVWFVWNGKKVRVQRVTYRWTEREGSEVYHQNLAPCIWSFLQSRSGLIVN